MNSRTLAILLAASAITAYAAPASAQDMPAQEAAQLRAEIAALKAELAAMEARVDAASIASVEAKAAAEAAQDQADGTSVEWKGAPEISHESGWSFKPRGRLMFDAGTIDGPDALNDPGLGFGNEVRRARLGVEGDIPGGFGYKFELDFAGGSAEITDALLSYGDDGLKVTVGQHNDFQSLEELTSSRFTSFMERAAFTDAFGFERRLGVSASYGAGDILVQGGVFTDNIDDIDDENNSIGGDARVAYMPKFGATQLHLGGSVHYRDLNDAADTVRYRQRPLLHFTDTRPIDTRAIRATSETGYGLEAAAIRGPFHVAGEAFWQKVSNPIAENPGFFGGYAEIGYFLTGESRGYKSGTFDRTKPLNPVDKGGIGAVQVNLRYDYLDLVDGAVIGGVQNAYQASLIWTPIPYARLSANYGRLNYNQAAVPAGADRDYGVDAFGMRAEVDF